MSSQKAMLQSTAEAAIRSIGLGFDVVSDIRIKYCKQRGSPDPCLIQLDHGELQDIVLPGGITVAGVTKSIKCDKGERMRFRSDVLSFQQVSFCFPSVLVLYSLHFLCTTPYHASLMLLQYVKLYQLISIVLQFNRNRN